MFSISSQSSFSRAFKSARTRAMFVANFVAELRNGFPLSQSRCARSKTVLFLVFADPPNVSFHSAAASMSVAVLKDDSLD